MVSKAEQVEGDHYYIERVKLENFLSFQKDEVYFGGKENKFIIVIGPNWSGKTSIFQAIKFALGSNERGKRYPKWSDFIRHNQDYAKVELQIKDENEKNIKIKRTVIRGRSPFFEVQRENEKEFTKVRAKEVRDIVKQMDFNPDNQFAIVSQGRIDEIKNLKPETLCSFLEEGVGLKSLRTEILDQKEGVMNLKKKLSSLLTEQSTLKVRLKMLQPKLEKLEKKKELLKEKQKYEDELLFANRKKVENEIKELKKRQTQLSDKIEKLLQKKKKNDKEIKKYQHKLDKIEQETNGLSKELGIQEEKKTTLEKQINQWQNEKKSMKKELEHLVDEISKKEKTVDNYLEQKKSLEKERKIIQNEKKRIEEQFDKLIEEQSDLNEKIKQNQKLLKKYKSLDSKRDKKRKKIDKNEEKIEKINKRIEQKFEFLKDVNHKLKQNNWFMEDPTANLLKKLQKKYNEIISQQNKLEKKKKNLNSRKFRKLRRLKHLQKSVRERKIALPSNIVVLKEEIEKRELNVKGPIIDYLKYDDKLSYAIESVLGKKLLFSFIAQDWDTKTILNRIKNKYNAYCNLYVPKKRRIKTFQKISGKGVIGYLAELIQVKGNDKAVKKVLYSKIKNCLVVEDYHSGKEMHNSHNFRGKCVTLDGKQIISYRYAYETPFKKKLDGLLSAGTQREQVSDLETEIEELNDALSELKVKQSKLDNKQRETKNKMDSFKNLEYYFERKQRLTREKNELYEQRNSLERSNESIEEEIQSISQQIKSLEKKTDPDFFKWNNRIKEIPGELNEVNQKKKKWNKKLDENSKIYKNVKSTYNSHQSELKESKKEKKRKEKEFHKADREAFELYRQLDKIGEKLLEIKEKISEKQEEREKIQKKREEFDQKSMELKLQLDKDNMKLKSIKQEQKSKENDLKRINKKLKPLIAKNEVAQRPVEEIKRDIKELNNDLLEYTDVSDDLLVQKDNILASLKEITKNKKNVEQDINAALKTEKKLEHKYYERFEKILEKLEGKINEKFQSSDIKSYCSLTLKGDFKHLGIDIKAATSKELVKSCTALSGGQVSMVSICLILSLQEIKPSPLCMFDEAAMFLDDKNSEAVYQLIKSTLDEHQNVQMILFLPKSSNSLFLLADKIIGIARAGKEEVSHVFEPVIIHEKDEQKENKKIKIKDDKK
ncbi:MAG: AAA family ATPase [Promethearchaeia archaeon]